MQLIKKYTLCILATAAFSALAASANAAYVVTLTNGESISAEDYKVIDKKIELKVKNGSASFPRSLVSSISPAGSEENLLNTPPNIIKPAQPPSARSAPPSPPPAASDAKAAPPPETAKTAEKPAPEEEAASAEGESSADDMTVEDLLNKEAEDEAAGKVSQEEDSQDETGFMKEDEQEDNITNE